MKTVLNVAFAVLAALVGLDRVYLNTHWLSDVIGGYMLGAFWTTLSILVMQHLKACEKNMNKL
jgi:undecaprenyl-diphosphatase